MSILGRVTSVSAQDGRVFVSVQHDRPGVEDQNIPFMSQAAGMMVTPTEGDIVEIYELDGIGTVAGLTYNPPSFSMPDLGENEMVFKFNEDTQISFRESENGGYTVDISADGKINLTAGGDVTVSTEGKAVVDAPTVKLGGDTGTKVVAREGDSVETSDPLTGTNTGTITSGSGVTESQ